MSTPTQTQAVAVSNGGEKAMEFVPYGGQDKIKLSIAIIKNLIAVKTKSGKTCSDNDAIKFMMMCQARRLNPFEGDAFLIGYDTREDGPKFSLITAHQAFLKRAELNSEYDGMKSGIIVERNGELIDLEGDFFLEGDKLMGGWATVHFKNRKQPMSKRIRLERFRKSFGVWVDDPAGMICKCAEADALRSSFPTMLGGLYLREELPSNLPDQSIKAAKPIFTVSSQPEPIKAPPTPASAQGDPVKEQTKAVRDLCQRDGVKESDLIEFANAIGLCDDGMPSLEAVFESNDTAAGMIVEHWDDFSTRIKETVKA